MKKKNYKFMNLKKETKGNRETISKWKGKIEKFSEVTDLDREAPSRKLGSSLSKSE